MVSIRESIRHIALSLRRESGNVDSSIKPGVRIYLKPEAFQQAKTKCIKAGFPIPDDQIEAVSDTLYKIRFPDGVYNMDYGACTVFQFATIRSWKESRQGFNRFFLPYIGLVRVEGINSREHWQNFNYDRSGTPLKI